MPSAYEGADITLYCISDIAKYSLYLRGLHDADPACKIPHETEAWRRDVRVSYPNDMKEWTTPLPLETEKRTGVRFSFIPTA